MKKKISVVLGIAAAALLTAGCLTGCGKTDDGKRVKDIIAQAEKMDQDDLYKKAMEEIAGKKYVVVANSSRMANAAPAWITYCRTKYEKPEFDFEFTSTQPKNNQIFAQIKSDVTGANHSISMTLIQDGSQIKSKMTNTGYLYNYIPKEWKGDKTKDGEPLALQSLNKVFCYNNLDVDTKTTSTQHYNNCWDFALKTSTQFMAPSSEPVGQNFMYMLTQEKYAAYVKEGYDALGATEKATVDALFTNKDTGIPALIESGEFCADAKYSLAWIYSFLKNYTRVSDDGPIASNLTARANASTAGLIVYSKFRSTEETPDVSNKFINIAAYQDNYKGFGGYMYKHYLQILKTSPYPWTSCALTHFMVCEKDGFQPWGKDMGGYCSNPDVQKNFDHSKDGGTEYPCKNDKGYDWWTSTGKLVVEDGEYCAKVAPTLSDWIAYL